MTILKDSYNCYNESCVRRQHYALTMLRVQSTIDLADRWHARHDSCRATQHAEQCF